MTEQPVVEGDPRADGLPICGITRTTAHTVWVCILPPHDDEHQRSLRPNGLGYYPRSQRHLFVNKYPHRERTP